MTDRDQERQLRRSMHAEFDSMVLPESLSSRILSHARISPLAGSHIGSEYDQPESRWRRGRKTTVVLAAAASVGVVALLAAVLSQQRSSGPDAAGVPSTAVVASQNSSTTDVTSGSQPSTRGSGSPIRYTYPYVSCGASWGDPVGSADLRIEPTWPTSLSLRTGGSVKVKVLNIGPVIVSGTGDPFVVVLRDGRVAGASTPDYTLVGHSSITLKPGGSFHGTPDVFRMYLCDGPDRRALPFDSNYEAVYVQRFGTRIAFSSPEPIAMLP